MSPQMNLHLNRRHCLRAGGAMGAGWLLGALPWLSPAQAQAQAQAVDWWSLAWPGPQGERVAAQHFLGRPLLVNFWATWCPPCVQELPLLNAFYRERRAQGWQVLALAVDQPGAVQRFLQQRPLDFAVALAGLGGTELSRQLGNASGGLPFTAVFNAAGALVATKSGRVHAADLSGWAAALPA